MSDDILKARTALVTGSIGNGVETELAADRYQRLITQPAGGSLQNAALAGRLFVGANQAAVSTTAALATTWTGLCLCNPAASGKVFIVHRFGFAQLAAGAAGGIGLMRATVGDAAAAITPRCAYYGYAGAVSSVAVLDNGCTPGTPVLEQVYGSVGSVATTAYGVVGAHYVDINGALIIAEGYGLFTYTTAATTTAFAFSFLWEEVDK